jgi:hypothetical protein
MPLIPMHSRPAMTTDPTAPFKTLRSSLLPNNSVMPIPQWSHFARRSISFNHISMKLTVPVIVSKSNRR